MHGSKHPTLLSASTHVCIPTHHFCPGVHATRGRKLAYAFRIRVHAHPTLVTPACRPRRHSSFIGTLLLHACWPHPDNPCIKGVEAVSPFSCS